MLRSYHVQARKKTYSRRKKLTSEALTRELESCLPWTERMQRALRLSVSRVVQHDTEMCKSGRRFVRVQFHFLSVEKQFGIARITVSLKFLGVTYRTVRMVSVWGLSVLLVESSVISLR